MSGFLLFGFGFVVGTLVMNAIRLEARYTAYKALIEALGNADADTLYEIQLGELDKDPRNRDEALLRAFEDLGYEARSL